MEWEAFSPILIGEESGIPKCWLKMNLAIFLMKVDCCVDDKDKPRKAGTIRNGKADRRREIHCHNDSYAAESRHSVQQSRRPPR